MKENGRDKSIWLTLFAFILIILAIILIILFLLNGQVTHQSAEAEISSSNHITCKGDDIFYNFISYDNSIKKTTKITAIFDNNKISSISLFYSLYYDDLNSIKTSETVNSGQFNVFFGKDGLPANSFSKSFSSDEEKVTFSLYADSTEFNDKTSKYFLVDGLDKNTGSDSFLKRLESQGLICKQNFINNN